jgi:hypothetical protein
MPTEGLVMPSTRTGRAVAAAVAGVALLGLAGCAQPVTGASAPAATPKAATSTPPPSTVVVQPSTVYVPPPQTVTVTTAPKPRTPCQKLHADGYSFDVAYAAWVQAGYPANWDADHDGLPCEQSYGEQN